MKHMCGPVNLSQFERLNARSLKKIEDDSTVRAFVWKEQLARNASYGPRSELYNPNVFGLIIDDQPRSLMVSKVHTKNAELIHSPYQVGPHQLSAFLEAIAGQVSVDFFTKKKEEVKKMPLLDFYRAARQGEIEVLTLA